MVGSGNCLVVFHNPFFPFQPLFKLTKILLKFMCTPASNQEIIAMNALISLQKWGSLALSRFSFRLPVHNFIWLRQENTHRIREYWKDKSKTLVWGVRFLKNRKLSLQLLGWRGIETFDDFCLILGLKGNQSINNTITKFQIHQCYYIGRLMLSTRSCLPLERLPSQYLKCISSVRTRQSWAKNFISWSTSR